MRTTGKQFQQLLKENKLVVCFIGMSNTGKTYWSRRLAALGFKHLNCDDLIEQQLGRELKKLGYSGIEDVSRWMGQPYDKRFAANQQKYLEAEKKGLHKILAAIKNADLDNTVIDTTGSFAHLDDQTCSRLRQSALMVYIEATSDMKQQMFKLYMRKPKPVVFGDVFRPNEGETDMQTLARCYPKLLEQRSRRYRRYADVIIPRQKISQNMAVDNFLALIEQLL
ncbi:AAA family ATPase [Candidatus Saccharibacteria bacterium]|nr:AAA family ATPase [Candidatus Saccharibacteria bacterium]